jgi:hypothetical protein
MSDSSAIRIVHPSEFEKGTLQTPGSERLAAVAPQLGVDTTLWGGLLEVKPCSRSNKALARELTIMASSRPSRMCCRAHAKCVGGEWRVRSERGSRRLHVPAFLLHIYNVG